MFFGVRFVLGMLTELFRHIKKNLKRVWNKFDYETLKGRLKTAEES